LTALGIGDVLRKNGIVPGRDVYLIGYDNIEAMNLYHEEPFLTTIDPHQEEMGQQLAMLLLQIIRGQKTETEKIPVEGELILRQSYQ
jgi:LacI family transcriptional regulator